MQYFAEGKTDLPSQMHILMAPQGVWSRRPVGKRVWPVPAFQACRDSTQPEQTGLRFGRTIGLGIIITMARIYAAAMILVVESRWFSGELKLTLCPDQG